MLVAVRARGPCAQALVLVLPVLVRLVLLLMMMLMLMQEHAKLHLRTFMMQTLVIAAGSGLPWWRSMATCKMMTARHSWHR